VLKKEKVGVLFDKRPKEINMAQVYRILEGPIVLPCASHNFYEKCADCTDEAVCCSKL
jgi:DNA-binding IscR family transcriptional regulator